MNTDIRIDDDFQLDVAEGTQFRTLFVRVANREEARQSTAPSASELRVRAVRGEVAAQVGWAQCLLNGIGAERDAEAAFRWLCIAGRSGDTDAMNMVGRCYEHGWGVASDVAEAALWYRRAADKGHHWGEFNLANLYAEGAGVPHDPAKALTLLVRAARRGNAKAMNMIGRYREGSDVPRRRSRSAALWTRWAADRGCFRGQFHHGRFLVQDGRIDDGIRVLRLSLMQAPQQFRREALEMLRAHTHPTLRELAEEYAAGERETAT
jgi:TPR repeat protein